MNIKKLTPREATSISFHVASDDAFATMATIINLLPARHGMHRDMRQNIVEKLMHMQKNYKIVHRSGYELCPKCGELLEKKQTDEAGTWFTCPGCKLVRITTEKVIPF